MLRIPRLVLEGELEEQAVNIGWIQIRGEPNELKSFSLNWKAKLAKTKTSHVLQKPNEYGQNWILCNILQALQGAMDQPWCDQVCLKRTVESSSIFKRLMACVISLLLAFQGKLLLPQQLWNIWCCERGHRGTQPFVRDVGPPVNSWWSSILHFVLNLTDFGGFALFCLSGNPRGHVCPSTSTIHHCQRLGVKQAPSSHFRDL